MRNKRERGRSAQKTKMSAAKLLTCVFMLFLSAALMTGAVLLFGLQKTPLGGMTGSKPAAGLANTYESYDKKYVLTGTNKKDTWDEATDAANAGGKVYVVLGASSGENWCLDGTGQPNSHLEIPANINLTLDLNGNTISRNLSASTANGGLFVVKGDFTLTDTVGGGAITGGWSNSATASGVHIQSGSFTMNGGAITNCKQQAVSTTGSSASVQVSSGTTFTMNGGTISGCVNTLAIAGGVRVSGTFTMNGGSITGNTSYYGGGVSVGNGSENGTFIMNGGSISGNNVPQVDGWGGGVAFYRGTFTMNGGEISGNYTAGNGGGILVSNGTFTMNGGSISGNHSGQSKEGYASTSPGGRTGGGVYAGGASVKFVMNGGSISNNEAHGTGTWAGGVIVNGNAQAYLMGGDISGNKASKEGGGIYMAASTVYLGAVTITGNTSTSAPVSASSGGTGGGGVACESGSNLHLVGGTVINGNKSGSGACNLYLKQTLQQGGRLQCHLNAGSVNGVSYPGFYSDCRMP